MFPPTHRIYRSIRPRNRFIIGTKRRGLQAVFAICISLILIIYGLENIYTTYDQYDFESQNFGNESRRRGLIFGQNVAVGKTIHDNGNNILEQATYRARTLPPVKPQEEYYKVDNVWWKLVNAETHEYEKISGEKRFPLTKYDVDEINTHLTDPGLYPSDPVTSVGTTTEVQNNPERRIKNVSKASAEEAKGMLGEKEEQGQSASTGGDVAREMGLV